MSFVNDMTNPARAAELQAGMIAASVTAPDPVARASSRILSILAASAANNPVLLPENGALATTTQVPFGNRNAAHTRAWSITDNPSVFSFSGGVPTYKASSTGFMLPCVTLASGGNFTTTRSASLQRMSFGFLGDSLSLALLGSPYRVLINGQYVSKTPQTHTTGTYNLVEITLPKIDDYRIDIEVSANAVFGSNPPGLATLWAKPSATVYALDQSQRLRVAVYADSFGNAVGADFPHNGFAAIMGYLLGGINVDTVAIAIGGTGYRSDRSGEQLTFQQHVSDLAQGSFDIVMPAGGINDGSSSPAELTVASQSFFAAARGVQPNALIVALGAWNGSIGPTATTIAQEQAIQAAVANLVSAGDQRMAFVPVQTDPLISGQPSLSGWIDNRGSALINASGAPGGGSPDGTHPGNVGHKNLGTRSAGKARSAIRALLRA